MEYIQNMKRFLHTDRPIDKLITLVMALVLLGGLASGCAIGQPKEYSDPSQGIEIGVGKQFIIVLEANPTTGYTWEADFDGNFLILVRSEFKPAKAEPGMVGVGGEQKFIFEGLKEGRTKATLTYKRPREQDFADQKVFTVHIK